MIGKITQLGFRAVGGDTIVSSSPNGHVPSDPREAAAFYLGLGRLPIPVQFRGKECFHADWPQLCPTAHDLDRLFPQGQSSNIGLLLGEPSGGLVDSDLDCREAIAVAPLLLPPTGWISGHRDKPRSHWWYVVANPPAKASERFDDPVRDNDDPQRLLLEFRSTGGQTVVPPSVHESGEPIEWDRFQEPSNADLVALQRAVAEIAAAALLVRYWPGVGGRQEAFLALVGGLLRAGWNESRTECFVAAIATATNDEEARKRTKTVVQTAGKLAENKKTTGWPTLTRVLGFPGQHVVPCVRNWLGIRAPEPGRSTKSAVAIRTIPTYGPFPVEVLPEPIREYVRQAGTALGCDPAYLALPALAAAASAIGNTRVIQLKRGWTEPSIVWSAIVGDSGTSKSPAYLKAVSHLFAAQKLLFDDYKQAHGQYQEDLRIYKESKKKAKLDGGNQTAPPEPPVLKRIVCGDTTIEMLAVILEANPRGVLIARDELAGWLGSFARYKGRQGGSDLPNWLELFRAGTVVVDRKTSECKTLFVPRAAASVTGSIQPGVLARAMSPEFLDAGLAARILMAMPPKLPKHWSELEVAPEADEAYRQILDQLLELTFENRDSEMVAYVLKLSPDAKDAWVRFYNEWGAEQAAAEGEVAAALSKLEAYAARFALIHHVVTHAWLNSDDRREVGAKSVEAGIALCRWFADEARRIYATLTESIEERDHRRLVDFIRSHGGRITVKQLQRSNSRRYPNAATAEAALDALVTNGLADWQDRPAPAQGGRPTRDCVLKSLPTTDETDQTDEPDEGPGGDGGGSSPPPSDQTPGGGAADAVFQAGNEVSSVSSVSSDMVRSSDGLYDGPVEGGGFVGREDEGMAGFVGQLPRSKPARAAGPPYILVSHPADLASVTTAIDNTPLVAVDLETTGLNPRTDRIRLLSLATDTVDGGSVNFLIDCFSVDPAPLWDLLGDKELVFHNGLFDLGFLFVAGFKPRGYVHDTMLLAKLLASGTRDGVSLAECCQRHLGLALDKSEQISDWSGKLSGSQLAYAARDVQVLVPLFRTLRELVIASDLTDVADLECRCLPALVWVSNQGVAINTEAWLGLAAEADRQAKEVRARFDAMAPPSPDCLPGISSWNWDSPADVKQAFAIVGVTTDSTRDDTLAEIDHPLASALRNYRALQKRSSTYGAEWLKYVVDGRVYAKWWQIGADSGRMSCSSPNLQNLPRDVRYRKCFIAPPGKLLVKADYSQIELRIAAKVANESTMIEAFRRGDDLHTLTAKQILGKEQVTKGDRQLAKALNFGLLYGMGAPALRSYAKTNYGVELSEQQAREYRNAFFQTYPGLAAWHRAVGRTGNEAIEGRTLVGRRKLGITHFTERLNMPVQGSGADGLKLALALLWERRDQCPGAVPVMAVHDEIVIECDADHADAAAAWLKQAMIDAMTPLVRPVPVEVEVKVEETWGG